MKAGVRCFGCRHASSATSSALCANHLSCAAWQPPMPWQRDAVGVGGWISTSTAFLWFSESWSMTELRRRWPQLTKSAQPYIACFETLAQLALAMLARRRQHSRHFNFVLPTASDNTAAEAGINKLFTTAEPLCIFLKLVASWSARRNVHLAVSHLAGEKNVWADELSRSKLHRLAHRTADRERIPLDMLARVVTLHPPHAAWAQPLLDAHSARIKLGCRLDRAALHLSTWLTRASSFDCKKRTHSPALQHLHVACCHALPLPAL